MKIQYRLIKSLLLVLLSSGTALADNAGNLAISFENDSAPVSSACASHINTPLPAPSSLSVVITNTNPTSSVTIKAITFNGHSSAEGNTGFSNILGNSDILLEQQYFLLSCNGKRLAPQKSCKVPLQYVYAYAGTVTNFTVTAVTDTPGAATASNTLTVNRTLQQNDFKFTISNVDANTGYFPQYPHSAGDLLSTSDAPDPYGYNDLLYYHGNIPPAAATLRYSITNTSDTEKTFSTVCDYYIDQDPNWPGRLPLSVKNGAQCDGVKIKPGDNCTGTLEVSVPNPSGSLPYRGSIDLWFSFYELGSPVPAITQWPTGSVIIQQTANSNK